MTAITVYGVVVLVFMMAMYALEGRHHRYIAAFAFGCALSSTYGFASGAWPFGTVEAIWCFVALRRYMTGRRVRTAGPARTGLAKDDREGWST